MYIEILLPGDDKEISEMSKMATEILREYYDPIIGKEQNDYMLELFQSEDAIRDQLNGMGIILEDTKEGVKWKRA